ncbi:hypothetical protein CSA17_06000 [bacterium DOLJORAL78_65_58]|nr:MAG: hypothetical protein CSA17_06000 [bacterium DOLJORAL78_65_58]
MRPPTAPAKKPRRRPAKPGSADRNTMIQLLERIRSDRAAAGEVLPPRAARLLEFSRVTDQMARHCRNARAAESLRARRPFTDSAAIAFRHTLADELRAEGQQNNWPPLMNLDDGLALLEMPAPVRYEGSDLVHLASVAEQLDALRDHFLARRERCPVWGEAAVQMATFQGVSAAIRRALDPDGYIVDGASALLARLRRSVAGQERAVRQEVNAAMSRARGQGWTTGEEVTLRGDRFCIPLRSGQRQRVDGIVHDRSSTGATLFVEPAGVVRLSNQLTETRLEIAAEEARILFELNRAVEQARAALQEAAQVMLQVDEVRAHLLWSLEVGGQRPQLQAAGGLRVSGGRHPLLMEALGDGDLRKGRTRVVPLELEIPARSRALVISGPNAGGKSVALKTVGVFCLLAQCGWDVPGRQDTRLPLITRLLVDLGDDQSIAQALSSFSAHLGNLAAFLREAGPSTLVLCDEIGSGTDPHEGTALAFSVLEAMDYDEEGLKPLYTFRVGDPGTSHAFDIAERMGLPTELLRRAREMAGEERVQIEQLLSDLDRRAGEVARQQHELQLALDGNRARKQELDTRLKELDKERRRSLEGARREADQLLKEGRRAIEAAVREIKNEQAGKRVVKAAHNRLRQVDGKLRRRLAPEDEIPPEARTVELKVGMRVRIPHLNLLGRLSEVRGNKVVAQAEGLRLSLGREAVIPLSEDGRQLEAPQQEISQREARPPDASSAREKPAPAVGGWAWQGDAPQVGHELDLRGETGADGWERLDRMIDRAIPSGLEVITVIHGFGTGRLRDYLYERLKRDSRVADFGEAGQGRGGAGATRIILKG